MTALAQTPEPSAKWTFDDTADLMAVQTGDFQMTPISVPISGGGVVASTLGGVGISSVSGPSDDSKAIYVPQGAGLKIARPEGSEATQSYTLMMDIMLPDATNWNSLLQTEEANTTDGDLFTHNSQIGIASIGGYFGNIKANKWYRIVLSYRNGKNILYVDGEKLVEANPDNSDRFKIQPFGLYLFCDESNDMTDNYVAEVAFWDTPLTDEQVAELGQAAPPVESELVEIASADDFHAFAQRP